MTNAGWEYNAEGIIRKGTFMGNPRVVGSATSCNGVAEFNSDYLDNSGICPAPSIGYLLSPAIHLEKPIEQGLVISFSQNLRQFQSTYYLLISKDDGFTFSDTIRLNNEYPVNSSHIRETKTIPIPGYSGIKNLRFKFVCEGNYYYWVIDDVVVYDKKFIDIVLDPKDYSVSPYYKTPISQVSEIPLMVKVNSQSNITLKGINLNFSLSGQDNILSINKTFTQLFPGYQESYLLMDTNFISPSKPGLYQGKYNISTDEGAITKNDTVGFQWRISEKTFGNLESEAEYGSAYLSHQDPAFITLIQTRNKTFGNIYYLPNGKGYEAIKARFGVGEDLNLIKGQGIRIDLFEYNDVNQDHLCQPEDRIKIGGGFILLSDSIPNLRNIETDIWAIDQNGQLISGQRVSLKNNQHYLLCGTTVVMDSTNFYDYYLLYSVRRVNDYYRSSLSNIETTIQALDSLTKLGLINFRSAGSVINIHPNNETNENIDGLTFSTRNILKVFMELDINQTTSTNMCYKDQIIQVDLFPNPAARDLFVDLALEKVSENVEVSMFDIEGRLVSAKTFNNIKEDRLRLDVSTLTNGVYNVKIVTAEGSATRKVIVQN